MFAQEPIEWPEEVEMLIDRLEHESTQRTLTREERAIMDVYETVPILESEDCLHEFWQSPIDHQRVIKSFDIVSAVSLVDALNASRWCANASDERGDYSDTEADYLANIEEDVPAAIEDLPDLIYDFIEEELG